MWTSDCWKCGHYIERVNFFCPGCDVIQEPVPVKKVATEPGALTHFDLFSLDQGYAIDTSKLEKTFWSLQKKLHPDRYGNKTEQEQEYSAEHSSALNDAYQTLKSPLDRAVYLLELNGVDALSEGGKSESDPFVLMRAMEAREELDECDTADDLAAMRERVSAEIAGIEKELDADFSSGNLEAATRTTIKLKYSVKLLEEINAKLSSTY